MEDSIDNKIKKIIRNSQDKKIEISHEDYGSCCIVVPKFTMSIIKNGEKLSTNALSIEDCCDNLLEKLEE